MKTIEEGAKEHSGRKTLHANTWQIQREIGFKAGAEFAQRWIPVEEEFPEIKEKSYQIIVKKEPTPLGTILIKVIAVFSFESQITLKSKLSKYTHWRPIEIK